MHFNLRKMLHFHLIDTNNPMLTYLNKEEDGDPLIICVVKAGVVKHLSGTVTLAM